MKINKVHLQNIGPHRDLTIDFSDLGPLIAITGENGAGKSFLIEAVVACLYGVFPSRPGSLYDRITQGFEGEAVIAIDFEMNGESYTATRLLKKTGKTTSAQGRLFKGKNKPGKLLSGPKINDFEQAVVNLLGPQDLFMASVFSSQANSGDICSARPSERKAVFGQLLGLEKFDRLSAAAKGKAAAAETEAASQEREISGLRERAKGLPAAQESLVCAQKGQEVATIELARQCAVVYDLEAKSKAGEIALERWRSLNGQLQKLDQEIVQAEKQVDNDRLEWRRLKDMIDRAPAIEKAEAALAAALEIKEGLQAELSGIEKENNAARLDFEQKRSELDRLTRDVEDRRRDRVQLANQAKLLDSTPNQACCSGCSLVASAVKAREALPAAIEAEKAAEKKVAGFQLGKLILKDAAEHEKTLREQVDLIGRLRVETADAPRLREAQGKMSVLAEAGKKKAVALEAKKTDQVKLKTEAAEAEKAIAGVDKSVYDQAKADQRRSEEALAGFASQIGALKERIAGLETAGRQADALEAQLAAGRIAIADYRAIEQAFGRSGIQPLIIEQARPELEQLAGEMLGAATGGRMVVRFETQKENKDGTIAESLDIIITMDGLERKIEEFSGGEQKMIRTAVRLTLAVWQARRGGSRLKSLFIDEIADALDGENSDRILKLLESLTGQFERIFIISHDDDLLAEMPVRINIERGRVEIIK
ncbi:MAG: SMC family ATPase [Candidatus Margulisiibacteriota bacterium]